MHRRRRCYRRRWPVAEYKYLSIRNWTKFQSGKYAGKSLSWLKDYSNQLDDLQYSKLTFFQRAVLQEFRRLRARLGCNVPYDLQYVGLATSACHHDRINMVPTVHLLITYGFLIPTNQQVDEMETPESKRERESNKQKKQEREKEKPLGHVAKEKRVSDFPLESCGLVNKNDQPAERPDSLMAPPQVAKGVPQILPSINLYESGSTVPANGFDESRLPVCRNCQMDKVDYATIAGKVYLQEFCCESCDDAWTDRKNLSAAGYEDGSSVLESVFDEKMLPRCMNCRKDKVGFDNVDGVVKLREFCSEACATECSVAYEAYAEAEQGE